MSKTTIENTREPRSLDALVGLLNDMLDNAQSIRVIQVQGLRAKRHKEKADAAWQQLNAAHKAAIDRIQPNATGSSEPDCSVTLEYAIRLLYEHGSCLTFKHHRQAKIDADTLISIKTRWDLK
jgi:hypothetical protein